MNCVFFYFLAAFEFPRPRSNEVMSYDAPIVIHDSDSESDLVSAPVVGSNAVSRADSARSPQSVADLATTSAVDSAPLPAASLASVTLLRTFLFDSDTETEDEFQTPPCFKTMTAKWQDKPAAPLIQEKADDKMGEDLGLSDSAPYDTFGPSSDNDTNQVEEDRQYAVYLDMDLNGRSAKREASKRLKETGEEDEQPKKKDRSSYWAKRYATQKANKHAQDSLYCVTTYFCGARNYNRTFRRGYNGQMFKRAIIPGTQGTIQHDLIIGSDRTFYRIVADVVTAIMPDENGKICVRDNCVPDVDLLFLTTFPPPVFPFM